jgi:hypothetical protein
MSKPISMMICKRKSDGAPAAAADYSKSNQPAGSTHPAPSTRATRSSCRAPPRQKKELAAMQKELAATKKKLAASEEAAEKKLAASEEATAAAQAEIQRLAKEAHNTIRRNGFVDLGTPRTPAGRAVTLRNACGCRYGTRSPVKISEFQLQYSAYICM